MTSSNDIRQAKIDALSEQKAQLQRSAQAEIDYLRREQNAASGPVEKARIDVDIETVNMELDLQLRALELERRMNSRETGNSYTPDFEGIVTATFLGIASSGAAIALYKGKKYNTIRKGTTSLRKGELVQLYFSGNSYYSDWS